MNNLKISRNTILQDAFKIMQAQGEGVLLLYDKNGNFERTITDGDLRRLLLSGCKLESTIDLIPKLKSITVFEDYKQVDILNLMNTHSINHVPVVDSNHNIIDIIHRKQIDRQILLSVPHLGTEEINFIDEAFSTNWIAPLGPNVDAFESEFASKIGINYAAAVSSGTAAIHLALKVLNVGSGDIVLCSSLTFAASAFPIAYVGAQPIFIDSDWDTWNMSPQALDRALKDQLKMNQKPKAVIVVNLYGQSANMDLIAQICNYYDVPIIEDAAESLGAKYKTKSSGAFGKLGCFSFNGNKIITTSGGGMVVSNDLTLIEKIKFLSTQARDKAPHYEHSEIGYNYRMSNILAGVGRGQLKVLDERVRLRRKVFDFYKAELSCFSFLKFMPEPDWSFSSHWLTAFYIDKSIPIATDDLISFLAKEMIEVRKIWKPMHLQPIFSNSKYYKNAEISVSDELFHRGICLPSSSNITHDDLLFIVKKIKIFFKRFQ